MGVSFNKGLLKYDIDNIVNKIGNPEALRLPVDPRDIVYDITLNTEIGDVYIQLKEHIDVMKDFNSNIGDHITASFMIGMGDFIHDVYPHRDNLELTIVKTVNSEVSVTRGKFIMTNNDNGVESSVYSKMTKEEANKTSKARIEGQLILPQVEAIRTVIITGIYNYAKVKDVIMATFKEASYKFKIANLQQEVNLDLIEPNNDRTYRHIKLVPNINVFDLPSYLQNTDYGVYNGNIGTYFDIYNKKPLLFVYPLYDYTLFDKREKKIMLFGTYDTKYDNIESTFIKEGDILKIVASKIKFINMGDKKLMDKGNNITRTNSKLLTEPNYKNVDNDKVVNDPKEYVVQKQYKKPKDGVVKTVYTDANDNEYKSKATMIRSNMSFIQVTWRFCEDDMIYPGMPIMFIYEKTDTEIIKYYGQVQGVFYSYDFGTKSQHAMLNIAVKSNL